MIVFECTMCKARLRVREDLAGVKGACPECGMVVTIPAAPASGDPLAALAAATAGVPSRPAPRRTAWQAARPGTSPFAVVSLGICVWPLAFLPVPTVLAGFVAAFGVIFGIGALAGRGPKSAGTLAMGILGLVFSGLLLVLLIGSYVALFSFLLAT